METFDGLSDLLRGDNSSQSSSCSACCSDKPIESDLGETNAEVLNVDVVKLRSFMSEYEQLKTTLDKVNDTMSIVKFDMETLRKENQQLKNEVNAKIDQIQVSDEMRQKDRTDFHRVRKIVEKEGLDTKQRLSNFFNETKKERIEHQRVLKVLEEKISLIMTENLELKEMQKQHLEEISVLKSKQTATEEFIDLSRTKIEEIKNANVDQHETFEKSQAAMEQMSKTVKLLGQQVRKQQLMLPMNTTEDDPFRTKANVSYTIQNIDQLESKHYSPPFYVCMLPCQLVLGPKDSYLSVYLHCNKGDDDTSWSCNANFGLKLKCHKADGKCLVLCSGRRLFENGKIWGKQKFILKEDLLQPDNGYVKNNSITIEVNIETVAPLGIVTLAS